MTTRVKHARVRGLHARVAHGLGRSSAPASVHRMFLGSLLPTRADVDAATTSTTFAFVPRGINSTLLSRCGFSAACTSAERLRCVIVNAWRGRDCGFTRLPF